jgi:rhodanese-related sulfurtransferase
MNGAKFETWLGSIIAPKTKFYLISQDQQSLDEMIRKTAKIGYEPFITGAFIYDETHGESMDLFDKEAFDANQDDFTIIDIRNASEVEEGRIFKNAINIPLPELENRASEISTDKPIVVHCGTGYRSAIGSSIIHNALPSAKVLDMSGAIKEYK